jgi:recombinational DNA repair ATPase RecF
VISLETVRIQEFRGIRDLTLDFRGRNFAICGNNGTGKSGVVDALEFALTGKISRLAGEGSGSVSVREHGPHVDMRETPDKAKVTLEVTYSGADARAKKKLTITRHLKAPTKPVVSPKDADGTAALKEIEGHPELVLSRRQLIRYVLTSPAERSKQVQALLRLEQLDQARAHLLKIANSADRVLLPLEDSLSSAKSTLLRALDIPEYTNEAFLQGVNAKRALLGLKVFAEFSPTLSVADGIDGGQAVSRTVVEKRQALRDVSALKDALRDATEAPFVAEIQEIKAQIEELAQDPVAVESLNREAFYANGLSFFDADVTTGIAGCPLCDVKWDPAAFRAHLTEKLGQMRAFADRRRKVEARVGAVIARLRKARQVVGTVVGQARSAGAMGASTALNEWGERLERQCMELSEFFRLARCAATLAIVATPDDCIEEAVVECERAFVSIPEATEQDKARTFLIVVQERIAAVRDAREKRDRATVKAAIARQVVETYSKTCDSVLVGIYGEVQAEFETLYRAIHHHDEKAFTAELSPSTGALDLKVDFYGRGRFPPAAYHSEGHQDGMGLCLYLALMKHLQGPAFTFAVLDDVLMSIDAGHRREVAAVLRQRFPGTQFILTTHDKQWLAHMKTEKLISNRSSVHFQRWTVGTGPVMATDRDVWQEAEACLQKDDVKGAAVELRHFLEYLSAELCGRLRVPVEFRPDGQYQLGELLPKAIPAFRELLRKAKAAANSYGKREEVDRLGAQEQNFHAVAVASQVEMWPVNTAIHYNSWENLTVGELRRVIEAQKALTIAFSCVACGELYRVVPAYETPEVLACGCTSLPIVPKKKAGPVVQPVH